MSMVAAWITVDDLADATVDPALAQEAVDAASFVLFMLSGRKYSGIHTTTEVYCQVGLDQLGLHFYNGSSPPLPGPSGYQLVYPELEYGVIRNIIGGCCSTCGCTHLLRLRGTPVLKVTALSLGGRVLDPGDYAVYDYSYIAAPNACWRACDDVTVSYQFGTGPPALGRIAAKALADQYLLAMNGSDECALPQRVTQVSRQGMSWTLLDPQDFLNKGRTGLYQVDLFLTTVNPDGARMRSRVFSPDLQRARTKRPDAVPAPTQFAAPVAGPQVAPVMVSTQMQGGGASVQSLQPSLMSAAPAVTVSEGRPLRWVVPGSFSADHPPVITVQPSGEEVPPDTLLWRTSNYTLDLSADQVAQLVPPGSVLVVSAHADDGRTTGQTSYPVERRTS